ncbi:MAG: hypothetical protein ACRC5A_11450 [Enterobacteriaceae bacterium]
MRSEESSDAQSQAMISFRPTQGKYQTADEFKAHADFAIFKQQCTQHLQLLEEYATQHGSLTQAEIVKENLNLFSNRLFNSDYYADSAAVIYGEAKRILDNFIRLLADEYLPLTLAQRVDVIQELAEGMRVCAGGSVGKMTHALDRLVFSTGDISNAANLLKEELIDTIIHQYVQEHFAYHKRYDSNEVHYISGLHNSLQTEFGLRHIPDNTSEHIEHHHIDACKERIESQLTPVLLAKQLAVKCQQLFITHLFAGKMPPAGKFTSPEAALVRFALLEVQKKYGHKISEKCLIVPDEDEQDMSLLCEDLSLLTLNMLESLLDAGIVDREIQPVKIAAWQDEYHMPVTLMHYHYQLAWATCNDQIEPLSVDYLCNSPMREWIDSGTLPARQVTALLEHVIREESGARLAQIPLNWLTADNNLILFLEKTERFNNKAYLLSNIDQLKQACHQNTELRLHISKIIVEDHTITDEKAISLLSTLYQAHHSLFSDYPHLLQHYMQLDDVVSPGRIAQLLSHAIHSGINDAQLIEMLLARDDSGQPVLNTWMRKADGVKIDHYMSIIEQMLIRGELTNKHLIPLIQADGKDYKNQSALGDDSYRQYALRNLIRLRPVGSAAAFTTLAQYLTCWVQQGYLTREQLLQLLRKEDDGITYYLGEMAAAVFYGSVWDNTSPEPENIDAAKSLLTAYCTTLADLYQKNIFSDQQVCSLLHSSDYPGGRYPVSRLANWATRGNTFALETIQELLTTLITGGWKTDKPALATLMKQYEEELKQRTAHPSAGSNYINTKNLQMGTAAFNTLMDTMKAHGLFEPPAPVPENFMQELVQQMETEPGEQVAQRLWQAGSAMDSTMLSKMLLARQPDGHSLLVTQLARGDTAAASRYLSLIEPVLAAGRLNRQSFFTLLQASDTVNTHTEMTCSFLEEICLQAKSPDPQVAESAQALLQTYLTSLTMLVQQDVLSGEQILQLLNYITSLPDNPTQAVLFIHSLVHWAATGNVFALNNVEKMLVSLLDAGKVEPQALAGQLLEYEKELKLVQESCPADGWQAFTHLAETLQARGLFTPR